MLLSFVDIDANRITFREFFDHLESNERFRSVLVSALAECELKSFVWETPSVDKRALVNEFECALTEVPAPPKAKVNRLKFAEQFREGESVVAFPSPEGTGQIVVPCPKQAEGWYADVATFLRRVHPSQVDALFSTLARVAKPMLASERVRIRSSAPGASWLHFTVGPSPKPAAYAGYAVS
jgi:hypothetical protein